MWPSTQRRNTAKAAIDRAIHEAIQVAGDQSRTRGSLPAPAPARLGQDIAAAPAKQSVVAMTQTGIRQIIAGLLAMASPSDGLVALSRGLDTGWGECDAPVPVVGPPFVCEVSGPGVHDLGLASRSGCRLGEASGLVQAHRPGPEHPNRRLTAALHQDDGSPLPPGS